MATRLGADVGEEDRADATPQRRSAVAAVLPVRQHRDHYARVRIDAEVAVRAELGAVKDRLATVERIVTDDSRRLTQEIEGLRGPTN